MPRMLKVLDQRPELGCLGFQQWLGRTTIWSSTGATRVAGRFARDTGLPHLEPWRQFNRAVRASGDVGIWHETFKVGQANTRPSTATCRSSGSRPPPGTRPPGRKPIPRPRASARPRRQPGSPALLKTKGVARGGRPPATLPPEPSAGDLVAEESGQAGGGDDPVGVSGTARLSRPSQPRRSAGRRIHPRPPT